MTDHSHAPIKPRASLSILRRLDRVWITFGVILLAIAVLRPAEFTDILRATLGSLGSTAILIAFAISAIAYVKASGAESLLARAFTGPVPRMIIIAAFAGGLSPFCSCQVIPFIAAMLALGVPLAPVMAFWLASPLMDPAMFLITAGTLGLPFAIAKTAFAVALGLLGGFGVMALARSAVFRDPLRADSPVSKCGAKQPFEGAPLWQFWREAPRRKVFTEAALENGLFLVKWLALAYLLEALMIRHLPAEWIASALGGEGFQPILLGAALGGPAYLNGYAAVPLISGLLSQGMSPGAAMSFVIAGGVSCIPAALAVWALVRPKVFAAYLAFAFLGALLAGLAWNLIA